MNKLKFFVSLFLIGVAFIAWALFDTMNNSIESFNNLFILFPASFLVYGIFAFLVADRYYSFFSFSDLIRLIVWIIVTELVVGFTVAYAIGSLTVKEAHFLVFIPLALLILFHFIIRKAHNTNKAVKVVYWLVVALWLIYYLGNVWF